MSYVTAVPEMLAAAATDVAAVGSAVGAAHLAAAAPTVAVIPAAADEVSAGIAHLFSRAAQDYHALAGRVAAFNEQFVQHLNAGARSYAATEAASAASLQGAALDVSTISAFPGQLLNALIGFWDNLTANVQLLGTILFELALLPVLFALVSGFFSWLTLIFAILAVQFLPPILGL